MAAHTAIFTDPRSGEPIFTRAHGREAVARRWRFDVAAGLSFEQEVGCGINTLLEKRQTLTAVLLGLVHGFRWEDPRVTKADVQRQLAHYIDNQQGDFSRLYSDLIDALNQCGTFGRPANPEKDGAGEGEPGADPPEPTPANA